MSGKNGNSESKHLNLSLLCFIIRIGAYLFFLEEEVRVGDPTLLGNTMQVHRRWAQLGASDKRGVVRRRRTSATVNSLSIMKFLFEALIQFSLRTKLQTSLRFLHGLSLDIGSSNRLLLRSFYRTPMENYNVMYWAYNRTVPGAVMLPAQSCALMRAIAWRWTLINYS